MKYNSFKKNLILYTSITETTIVYKNKHRISKGNLSQNRSSCCISSTVKWKLFNNKTSKLMS